MQAQSRPGWFSPTTVGVLCGTGAALSWGAAFVAARHGVQIGFSPADLAFHRFAWAGILLLPVMWRMGFADLGGIGWRRGILIFLLAGPTQGILSATGFTMTPLGHGALIQPGTAALCGLLLATVVVHEPLLARRVIGAAAIVLGLLLLAAEAVTTIGGQGLLGDLCFLLAGAAWAVFGTLLKLWNLRAQRVAVVISVLSLLIYVPAHALLFGFERMIALGLWENLLQALIQGGLAGALALHLFARAVALLGAGRAAAFPALVPPSTLLIGFLALGEVPSLVQLAGLAIVGVGFRFVLKP